MNKIEEQILKNQRTIMVSIFMISESTKRMNELDNRIKETYNLLNPVEEPSLPEQTKNAFSEPSEDIKKQCQEAIERIESGKYITEEEFFAESELPETICPLGETKPDFVNQKESEVKG